jgi:hypothetical protein
MWTAHESRTRQPRSALGSSSGNEVKWRGTVHELLQARHTTVDTAALSCSVNAPATFVQMT